MHLVKYLCVSLVVYCVYVCTAAGDGSGYSSGDEEYDVQSFFTVTFSSEINCSIFEDYLTELFNDTRYYVDVEGDSCQEATYNVTVRNSTSEHSSANKTAMLKDQICSNEMEIGNITKLGVDANITIDGNRCEQSFSNTSSASSNSSTSMNSSIPTTSTVNSTSFIPTSAFISASTNQSSMHSTSLPTSTITTSSSTSFTSSIPSTSTNQSSMHSTSSPTPTITTSSSTSFTSSIPSTSTNQSSMHSISSPTSTITTSSSIFFTSSIPSTSTNQSSMHSTSSPTSTITTSSSIFFTSSISSTSTSQSSLPTTVTTSSSISSTSTKTSLSSTLLPTSAMTSTSKTIPTSYSSTSSSSTLPIEPTLSTEPESSIYNNLVIVVPTIGTTILFILIAISLFMFCMMFLMRRKKKKIEKDANKTLWEDTKPAMGAVELQSEVTRPLRPSRVSFVSKGNLLLQTLSHPLSIEELGAIVELKYLERLNDEYMKIPPNMTSLQEIPVGAEDKNRYIDVLPNPNTRVPLFLKFGVIHSDYINANYIRGHRNQGKVYIAAQGPMKHTLDDFWRMIWEQKISVVIMTTGIVERNIEKCYKYWPKQEGYGVTEVYGGIQVVIRKKKDKGFYSMMTFSVQHLEKTVTREVFHYQFTGWPDHGVPKSPDQVVDFLLATRTNREGFTMPGPTLVHCSAGIGRTGVFIAADIGMRQLEENSTVDILKIVATIRQDRGGMVQTKQQYVFLHKVLYEYAGRIGHVSQLSARFDETEEEQVDRNSDVPNNVASNTFTQF